MLIWSGSRKRGCVSIWNATFLIVEATPCRRMTDLCSVKTVSLVRGMMSLSRLCGLVKYSRHSGCWARVLVRQNRRKFVAGYIESVWYF